VRLVKKRRGTWRVLVMRADAEETAKDVPVFEPAPVLSSGSTVPATGVPSKKEASTDAITLAPFRTAWRSVDISIRKPGFTMVAT